MKIKISDLQKIQNELDSRIFEKHNTTRQETRNDRILALLVEAENWPMRHVVLNIGALKRLRQIFNI